MKIVFLTCMLFCANQSFAFDHEEISSLGTEEWGDTVLGGTFASGNEPWAKYVVAVMDLGTGGTCGGVLIASQWVLTAAHCVEKVPEDKLFIFYGKEAQSMVAPVTRPKPGRVLVHPERKPNSSWSRDTNDLALIEIRLPSPAPFQGVKSVESQWSAGMGILFVGYGVRRPRSDDGLGLLQFGWASVTEPNYGQKEARVMQRGVGACMGDSGSPVFTRTADDYALAALVSRGDGSCSESIITKVRPYLDWIKSVSGVALP